MFKFKQQQLDNGLRVMTVSLPALKSITAMMLVNTGSRFEKPGFFGAAHLLEHVVFKGTHQYPNSRQLSIALDEIGALSNAFTSKESTGYYVTAAGKHLTVCLNLLKELIFYPLLKPEDIEREKLVVAEEIKMLHDSPEDFIAEQFEQMLFKGSSLEHDISGSLQDVAQLNQAKLQHFLEEWYGLENMVLVVAGDAELLEKANFFSQVNRIFQDQPEGRSDDHECKRTDFLQKNPISNDTKVNFKRKTAQTHLVLGWPALKRNDPQRYVLNVLATIMGGNRSSRLFDVVREQSGLAYYVFANISQYHDGGVLEVSAGLNRERAEEGIELIIGEFEKLANGRQPISLQELKRAQDYLTGKMILGLENSRAVAQQYGLSQILLGKVETPQQIIKKIQQVTLEQLKALAKQIIDKKEVRVATVS